MTHSLSRRNLIVAGIFVPAVAVAAAETRPAGGAGISRANAAIHHEVRFKASPARVYKVLTNAKLFDRLVVLSGAMESMALGVKPCRIDLEPGGSFELFGGYITGRQIELAPGQRLVQTWRSAGWRPHIHSIARFELTGHAGETMLMFDHTGIPNEEAESLAKGWREHYWMPLAKVLAERV